MKPKTKAISKRLKLMCSIPLLLVSLQFVHADNLAEIDMMQKFMGLMQDYYGIIDVVYETSRDREKSAILQLQKIMDIYKERGDGAEAIVLFQSVIKKTKSYTIRNAAALMLSDLLKETGQSSKAVNVLKEALEDNLATL